MRKEAPLSDLNTSHLVLKWEVAISCDVSSINILKSNKFLFRKGDYENSNNYFLKHDWSSMFKNLGIQES